MLYLLMGLFAAAIVAADQLSKLWVINNIAPSRCKPNIADCQQHIETLQKLCGVSDTDMAAMPSGIEGIPGLFKLSHVHNTGAAFSSFQGQRWLFALVFILFTAAIVWEFSKKRMPFTAFERWCIAAVFAGGLGNMIDRLRLGYVVDMIAVDFMDFPVFNVADCFITCGCIALMISLVFFNKAFWKDDKKR